MLNEVISIVKSVLGKVIQDKDKRLEAETKLTELAINGDLNEEENRVALLMQEVKSNDKFISRARPSFIYLFLGLLLLSAPIGVLNIIRPEYAVLFCKGSAMWLDAIPDVLWNVFIAGYLGYGAYRTVDKINIKKKS